MPSVYDLKPRFQALLRPIVRRLAGVGVTANQVTVAAVLLSAIGGGLVASYPADRWPLALLPIILLLRMGLNAVDGMLAREFGQASRLGARPARDEVLDELRAGSGSVGDPELATQPRQCGREPCPPAAGRDRDAG